MEMGMRLAFGVACALLAACGSVTHADSDIDAGADSATEGAAGSSGMAGDAGTQVIEEVFPNCVTGDGSPGMFADVFPLPEGPRPECHALNQPGTPDSSCSTEAMIVCSIDDCYDGEQLAGCCRPDGFCGLLETGYWDKRYPLGCISRDPWIQHAEIVGHPVTAMRCGP
jgi:hypothetical protein